MTIIRWLLLQWNIIESAGVGNEIGQAFIAGTEKIFNEVSVLLQKAEMQERVLGRIDPGEEKNGKSIDFFNNISNLVKLYSC